MKQLMIDSEGLNLEECHEMEANGKLSRNQIQTNIILEALPIYNLQLLFTIFLQFKSKV